LQKIQAKFETKWDWERDAEEMSTSQARTAKQTGTGHDVFECMPAFILSHACIVTDLTTSTGSARRPIVTIDRRVGTYPPALPK